MLSLRLLLFSFLFMSSFSQQIGNVKQNDVLTLPMNDMGKVIQSGAIIDSNWRWIHDVNGYTNCFDNGWNKQYCTDPISCAKNCAIEGVSQSDYKDIYGVSVSENSITLNYVTA
jgi:hypothetical protein